MAAVGFDWIFFAIVAPWPVLAIGRLVMMRYDVPDDRNRRAMSR